VGAAHKLKPSPILVSTLPGTVDHLLSGPPVSNPVWGNLRVTFTHHVNSKKEDDNRTEWGLLMLQPPPLAHVVSLSSLLFSLSCCYCAAFVPVPPYILKPPLITYLHTSGDLLGGVLYVRTQHSSSMVPPSKTKQTSLDSFGRPITRLARKEAEAKGSRATKSSDKQKEVNHPEQSRDPEEARQGGHNPPVSQGLKHATLSAEEGRAFLEEEAIIDSVEQIDVDVLTGALVQIALMEGMTHKVSHAVRSVALMLAQLRVDAIGDSILKSMEMKLDVLVDKATENAVTITRSQLPQMDSLAAVAMEVQEKLTEVAASLAGMSGDTSKLTEMVTSYRDIVVCSGLSSSPHQLSSSTRPTPLAPMLQAREAVRARQVLLDFDDASGPAVEALLRGSITALKDRLDEALGRSEDNGIQVLHKTRAVTKLRNSGILMELDSDGTTEWFAQDHI